MSEWISVKDRLPEKSQNVLAAYKSGEMIVAHLFDVDEDCTFWHAICDAGWESETDFAPDYWMPLPTPPEKMEGVDKDAD